MNDADRHQVARPTEAQLRWSQFHHRRRAAVVKTQVGQLWQQPGTVKDVPDAVSDDGNTTEESNTEIHQQVPRQKPVISRGRRALLKVSKQAFQERHQEIEKYGYYRGNDVSVGSSDEDELAALFAEDTFRKKRKRRQRRGGATAATSDQERVRRFEAAFHAMMMNLAAAAQPQHPDIKVPTKIWSRPDGPHADTVDGREYMDLKWGVVPRDQKKNATAAQLMDRGASWLVHLPPGKNSAARQARRQQPLAINADGRHSEFQQGDDNEFEFAPSPVRQRFSDIVFRIQQNESKQERSPANREAAVPTMRLSKYFMPAQLQDYHDDDDEKKEEQQLLNHYLEGATNETSRKRLDTVFAEMAGGSPTVQERVRDIQPTASTEKYIQGILENVDSDMVHELEALDPGITERLLIRYMEETNFDPAKDSANAVCQHVEVFASKYLVELRYFEGQRKEGFAGVKSPKTNYARSNGLVKRFVDHIQGSDQVQELISADGRLHKPTFALLVTQYLGETNQTPLRADSAVRRGSGRVAERYLDRGSAGDKERLSNEGAKTFETAEIVNRFIARMQDAAEIESVVNAQGKLDLEVFENMVSRYLAEASGATEEAVLDAQDLQTLCAHEFREVSKNLQDTGRQGTPVTTETVMPELCRSPMTSGQAKSNGLVKRFVDHIQGSDQVQELISADGRLHKPTFALLVTQYLGETNQTPLRADSAVRRGSGRVAERYLDRGSAGDKERLSNEDAKTSETAEIVNRFIARMQDAAEIESVVNAQGKLDLEVFENMVSRYLAEASGATEEAVLDAQDLQTLCAHEFREVSKNLQDTGRQGTPVTTETVMPESRRVSAAFTKRFIAQMEQAAEVEPMATADGKLNKATFEKLTTRYLVQSSTGNDNNFLSQARSPLALAQARRNAGRGGRRMAIVKQESVIEDFGGPQSPGFIRHFVQQMEDAAEREPFVTAEGRLDEPAFERLVKKSLAEAATASYALDNGQSRAISEVNADYTAFPPLGSHASTGFVEQFVAHMEEVSRDEEFVAVDKPLLEELVLRCLVAFEKDDVLDNTKGDSSGGGVPNIDSARSPLQDNSEKQCGSFDADVSRLVSSGFVEGLVDHLDEVSKKEPLIDSDGSLNIQTFKKEMARFLDEIASPSTKAASVGSRSLGLSQGASKGQPSSSSRHQHFGGDAASLPGVQESPTGSAFFRDMRQTGATTTLTRSQQSDTFSSRRDDVKGSADYSDQVEGLEEDESVVDSNVCTSEAIQRNGIGDETSKNLGMAHRFAGSVSKVGGFVQMMYGKARSTKEEELQAVAAFRRTQGDRDDTSSLSSFRISDGMKQVVESFRASKLSTKNESDEYGFAEKDFDQESVGDLARRSSYESQEASASLYSQGSFSASESEAASGADFSPERAKFFRQIVMDKSALIGEGTAERSIIDTDGSDASRTVIDAEMIKNLLLSPTILTKRHQQAIRAVEQRSWEQISYLLSANPWLAEMNDLSTGQYLLHKLALYGAGEASIDKSTGEVVAVRRPAAPDQINTDLIRMFPASVHKFDQDGNLPLHMAAASANSAMIKLLGDRFPSGASVRNEDGMLPLHLTILACASPSIASLGEEGSPIGVIKTVLQYFPSAVAVVDNEGNLPIHTAAAALSGHIGVDVVYLLLDEANRQMKNPSGVRFRNKVKIEDIEDTSIATETTVSPTDSANGFNDITHCNMVRNDFGETPLLVAIHARAGWELIEAIACGEDGRRAALWQESGMQNALHLLVSDRFKDPAAALSILKVAPAAAAVRNEEGMLPIEIACMQMLPREVILALVLVDLPISLDQKVDVEVRDGFGGSWWYLACECDDHYVDVVEEVVSILSYPQVREACFMPGGSDESLISRATPKCRNVLQRALRFVGRFEFLGNKQSQTDDARGLKVFEALDFGTKSHPIPDGRRVLLKCFAREDVYLKETALLRQTEIDFTFTEEVLIFAVGEDGSEPVDGEAKQFCVAIERPNLTLSGVASGMLDNEECQTDSEVRQRYNGKVFSVLRLVAKALHHLHSLGIVHGQVCLENCGKYDDKWKLSDTLDMQQVGAIFDSSRFDKSAPPEAIEQDTNTALEHQATFRPEVLAERSFDSWAFGKLAYEVLLGEELVAFDRGKAVDENNRAMMDILHWSNFEQRDVEQKLKGVGVSKAGVDMIVHCLSPKSEDRPTMDQILSHPVWNELRRQVANSGRERRRGRA